MHPTSAPDETLVACLCAAWCGSCREYVDTFEQVRARLQPEHPTLRFVWIDIEDQSDLVDPIDVENFPTLLIATGSEPRFFGPLTPQPDTLARLVRSQLALPSAPGLPDAQIRALVERIRALPR